VDGGFVGRSVELRRIAEMIARAECRLLCLLGPGGVGKTRLAQRAMQDLAPRFAGGIGFVALEDVRLPRDIGARIATALGVAPAAREMPMDAVVGHLRELAFLLVLDNFEHLASDASAIEQLLAACPGLSIIVTSRVRLALPSEWVLPLEGLPCPEEEDADRLEAFDAARLFVQAARRVQPALAPAAEASAIIDICHQVEGLPLALQLAAGWTRVLSCEAIADELRRGTDLLQAADGTRGERHASFDVVFEQSWRLLTASERDVLSRLSVFRGTIAHDAARSVAGASLPVLGALVDKSLLRKEGTRLAMHPLVQQLAAARLDDERGRLTRAAHAAHFLNGLAQVAARTEEGDRATLEAIDADLENCRLAWQQATADGQGEALMRAAPALHDYFDHRARFDDGLAWFRGALEAPHARTNASARARLLGIVAHLEFRLARFLQAESTAREALSAAPSDDDVARFRALAVLASCAMDTGRLQEAAERFDEVLAIARDAGLARDLASSLENLALVHKRLGRYESSLSLSLDALSQHRRNGDTAAVALCLSNLGSLTMFMGQDEAAAKHLDEALVLSERAGLASTRAFVLANMTELAMNARDDARARQLAERALEVADGAGIRPLASWLQVQLARLAIRRGDLGDARARLAEAADLALAVASPIPKAAPLLAFAELMEAQGHPALGRRVLAFGMQQPDLLAPSRDELRQAWEARGGAAGDEARWPELSLDQLLQRIVAEAELEHAPLRAALGATA
jgi:predicted ATPase